MSIRNFRENIARTSSDGDVNGRVEVRCGPRQINIMRPHQTVNFRVGTLNVGTMKGRAHEITETVARKNLELCCLQETRWRCASARKIMGEDCTYKFFWSCDSSGIGGVGILLAGK